jgi:membrane protease YdiL (CAAX protease family)
MNTGARSVVNSQRRRFVLAGALILNFGFGLTANLVAFQATPLRALAQSTYNWLSPTLVVNAIAFCIIVGGWLVAVGRESAASLGFRRSMLGRGIGICLATWIAIQVFALIGQLASGYPLLGRVPGLSAALPVLFGQLAGNALYEETFYRGYLIRALTPEVGGREWAAVLLSAALFGVMHIPNYLLRGLSLGFLVPATLAGVLFGFLYLRTRNLWLCIGLHSLLNVPATLWDSPVPGYLAPTVALFLCLGFGSRLQPPTG